MSYHNLDGMFPSLVADETSCQSLNWQPIQVHSKPSILTHKLNRCLWMVKKGKNVNDFSKTNVTKLYFWHIIMTLTKERFVLKIRFMGKSGNFTNYLWNFITTFQKSEISWQYDFGLPLYWIIIKYCQRTALFTDFANRFNNFFVEIFRIFYCRFYWIIEEKFVIIIIELYWQHSNCIVGNFESFWRGNLIRMIRRCFWTAWRKWDI